MVSFEQNFYPKISKAGKETLKKSFEALKEEKESKKVGYYELPKNGLKTIKELKTYQKENPYLKKDSIKNIIVVGIGGSSLGTKAVYEFLKYKTKSKRKLHFLENVDPIIIGETLQKIKKENTLFLIISKSGTTIETTSIFKFIIEKYKFDLSLKKDANRFAFITDKNSSLSKLASDYSIKQFNIPKNVGGRFSVLSAVGIVPLSLVGIDVKELLDGAKGLIDSFFEFKEKKILKKAYFYSKLAKKYPINVLFSYSSLFTYFNQWYVQLWGESLGKHDMLGNSVGLTPVHLVGSVDQHSFLQLILEGPKDKTVTVIKVEDFKKRAKIPDIKLKYLEKTDYINNHSFNELLNEECNATYETILENEIPADMIVLDRISAQNIGILIAYYELLTSSVGQMLMINVYNQPGVEFGKQKLVQKFEEEA
ncbi:glucose-6-phosphate isomerase [Arcobacter sp. F155]|uniref:glucose-6-phosphate isomerase n=1 Tax=Arcobacter sp. F155 TaxID=2044512 RepID=UPI00100A8BF3|nr:glucose-6-phosphate isomerase [Arcobacter sp. F155]RXJ76978.1 glucose-6-phosphate isomerase [Arcobacter sp. F155]